MSGAKSEKSQFSMSSAQIELEFPVLMLDLQLLYRKYFNQQMKAANLTTAQWQVLSCLTRNEGITQTEVADRLNKGKSPVGKTLDTLEAAEWVVRKPSVSDRRVKNIYLTGKLKTIDEQLMQVVSEMNGIAEQNLDSETVEKLRRGLAVMRENLQKALGES